MGHIKERVSYSAAFPAYSMPKKSKRNNSSDTSVSTPSGGIPTSSLSINTTTGSEFNAVSASGDRSPTDSGNGNDRKRKRKNSRTDTEAPPRKKARPSIIGMSQGGVKIQAFSPLVSPTESQIPQSQIQNQSQLPSPNFSPVRNAPSPISTHSFDLNTRTLCLSQALDSGSTLYVRSNVIYTSLFVIIYHRLFIFYCYGCCAFPFC